MTVQEMKIQKKALGYSTEKLSAVSGVPVGTLNKILSGQTKHPRIDTMQQIEAVLSDDRVNGGRDKLNQDYGSDERLVDQDRRSIERIDLNSALIDRLIQSVINERERSYAQGTRICENAVAYGAPVKQQGEYTIHDLEGIPEGRLCELIDGVLYDYASPTVPHQQIAQEVFLSLMQYKSEKGKACKILLAPVDVYIDPEDDRTCLIPDLVVVCDKEKVKRKGIYGAPDFILEVLSPSTARKDRFTKAYKYIDCGVREYWMIDPGKKQLLIYDYLTEGLTVLPLEGKRGLAIGDGQPEIDLDRIREIIEAFQE